VFRNIFFAFNSGLNHARYLYGGSGCISPGTPPPALNFQLPTGYQIPPSDQQCILKGERLNLQCIIANDPDAKRIRAEEAMLEAKALAAANSGKLDPYHQVQLWASLRSSIPTSP